MGSPYLSSNESIILSTSDIVVNTVPAEAILTNERLMLVDTRHAELRPQDIPFHAIETVTIGESATQDPMLSLSIVTGPGVTQSIGMVFPQAPKMRRVAERDEWAARLKELSIVSARDSSGPGVAVILPPWVPGPLPGTDADTAPAATPKPETGAAFSHAPLAPRRMTSPAAPKNRMAIAAAVVVILLIAVAAVAYIFAPSLLGRGGSVAPAQTSVPVTALTTVPTPVPTTIATPVATTAPAEPATTAVPQIAVPQTGVWVKVSYEGTYSGSIGAPGRFRDVSDFGTHWYQIPAKDEIITVSIQKLDNTGRTLSAEVYKDGRLIKSGSINSPKGLLDLEVGLKDS